MDRRTVEKLLTSHQVAERLNVHVNYVYSHAEELGGIPLRSQPGKRCTWRFRPELVEQYLAQLTEVST